MSLAVKLPYILKLLSTAAWVIILPVTYAYTSENPTSLARTIKSWLGDGRNQPSLYILAVVVYLAPNMLAATLILFPVLRRALERSNLKVRTFMMWWSQPCLFVGRGMHEGAFSLSSMFGHLSIFCCLLLQILKKPKVMVAEAATLIDAENLAAHLVEISVSYENQHDIQLMRFADYFGRAFASVSASQFPWAKMFKESSVSKMVDIPLCHIPGPVRKMASDWINQRSDAIRSSILSYNIEVAKKLWAECLVLFQELLLRDHELRTN